MFCLAALRVWSGVVRCVIVSLSVQKGGGQLAKANYPRLNCFSADPLAMDVWENFYISLNCIHKAQLKVKVPKQRRF